MTLEPMQGCVLTAGTKKESPHVVSYRVVALRPRSYPRSRGRRQLGRRLFDSMARVSPRLPSRRPLWIIPF